ncbi:hypothetical protein [Actinoplanes couchii]|uniref:Uncharacterized protein n=1 Tax=Actinoplanes couchii TaxID=403638 RepID=A0ABQ3XSL5_9ACTN|nr:hypothetical protein [Actinoplanes couchii]MDR6318558.1 aconitase A [Actinoplanes couchii]GID61509.1 hypothetical protein Aco03nite_099130 [Actinoplanes couchii]
MTDRHIIGPGGETVSVTAGVITFTAVVRLDTAREVDHQRHGGILPYVLRHPG